MSLKKILFFLSLEILCHVAVFAANPNDTPTTTGQQQMRNMRRDELESTDSLAIPLDSSEDEQEDELEELENQEKQYQHHNSRS